MDEKMNFDNFSDIWQRVEQHDDDIPSVSVETEAQESVNIIKQCAHSRCVRFLPKF